MKPSRFNPHSSHPMRALQAWQILIAAASNRQTLTYKGLSNIMYGKDAAGVLAQVLGHIAYWCDERRLPQLNAIVVAHTHGKPGDGIPLPAAHTDVEREKVYDLESWYDLIPPTEAELAEAFKASR